jgi:TatD DNase family protein
MWIDIHAHLYDFDMRQLAEAVSEARRHRVSAVINAATSLQTADIVTRQCAAHSNVYATVGVSPFDADGLGDGWDRHIESLLDNDTVVGIGEIGIDGSNPAYPSMAEQMPVFERQLEIAKARSMPAVIHSRGAERRAVDTCITMGIERVVFHCFTGSLDALRRLLDAGYDVSFSGIITFKNGVLKDLVSYAPLERLCIETDTPYLAPVPHRGRPNRVAWAAYVGEAVAAIKLLPADDVASQIGRNVERIFGIRAGHANPAELDDVEPSD